jgi:2,4-dienoyl-CoA reductase-like NADH-dependent reductase (Old Yellow Enzyme family)
MATSAKTSHLFSTLALRSLTARNRVWVSPMCQYSCEKMDGVPTDWHLVHLGGLARGGAGLVMAEATAVRADGRISPQCTGIWGEEHVKAWARITEFISSQGSIPGLQLAHAGRKGSTTAPWLGGGVILPDDVENGGWQTLGPSEEPFNAGGPPCARMTLDDIAAVREAFVSSAERALRAGFKVIELHFAHGYLGHSFLSPAVNKRTDAYGGSFENRIRFPLETAAAVRAVWPADLPLFARISATDWLPEGEGWDVEQSVRFAQELKAVGVDLIDVSSGAAVPHAKIPIAPGFQVPLAARVRKDGNGVLVSAVGLITEPAQAEAILASGDADAVFLAREMLRDPHWPLHAAKALGVDVAWPKPYMYGKK